MKKKTPKKNTVKTSAIKRFLGYIKKEWNSLMYWLMFKNYECLACKGNVKKCNCQ